MEISVAPEKSIQESMNEGAQRAETKEGSTPDFSKETSEKLVELLNFKYASIRYAQMLQDSMLHEVEGLYEIFPESFLFNAPKDIVSGDFYWFERLGNKAYVAVADCTGHGIPGAMLTILCTSKLHEIIKGNYLKGPARILDITNRKIFNALSKKYRPRTINDGMDIGLFSVDFEKSTLEFAGANRTLCLVRNKCLTEVYGDKVTVGVSLCLPPFNTYQLKVQPGDMVYLFSDGYTDQFGGERGKKFSYKSFVRLLVSLSDLPATEQHEAVRTTLREWMGKEDQVDDVTVLGIRIP